MHLCPGSYSAAAARSGVSADSVASLLAYARQVCRRGQHCCKATVAFCSVTAASSSEAAVLGVNAQKNLTETLALARGRSNLESSVQVRRAIWKRPAGSISGSDRNLESHRNNGSIEKEDKAKAVHCTASIPSAACTCPAIMGLDASPIFALPSQGWPRPLSLP